MQVVAKTVTWSGNASLAFDYSAYGIKPITYGGGVTRLRE